MSYSPLCSDSGTPNLISMKMIPYLGFWGFFLIFSELICGRQYRSRVFLPGWIICCPFIHVAPHCWISAQVRLERAFLSLSADPLGVKICVFDTEIFFSSGIQRLAGQVALKSRKSTLQCQCCTKAGMWSVLGGFTLLLLGGTVL